MARKKSPSNCCSIPEDIEQVETNKSMCSAWPLFLAHMMQFFWLAHEARIKDASWHAAFCWALFWGNHYTTHSLCPLKCVTDIHWNDVCLIFRYKRSTPKQKTGDNFPGENGTHELFYETSGQTRLRGVLALRVQLWVSKQTESYHQIMRTRHPVNGRTTMHPFQRRWWSTAFIVHHDTISPSWVRILFHESSLMSKGKV